MSNLARCDLVDAIKGLAQRAKLDDIRDNGLALVISARSTEPLIGFADQLKELDLCNLMTLVPSTKGYDLFAVIPEITHA